VNPLSFLGALNPKAILTTVVLVAATVAVVWFGHVRYEAGVTDGTTTATAKYNQDRALWLQEKAQAVATAAKAVQDRLDEAQRRIEAQDEVISDAQQQMAATTAAAAVVRRDRDGLRKRLDEFVNTSTGGGAGCGNSTTAQRGTAADERLLASLFADAADQAASMAAEADANRVAGLACQRAYQALMPASAAASSSEP